MIKAGLVAGVPVAVKIALRPEAMSRAVAALDYTGQAVLTVDLLALIARYNRSGDATMVVPGEYLEAVATRAG